MLHVSWNQMPLGTTRISQCIRCYAFSAVLSKNNPDGINLNKIKGYCSFLCLIENISLTTKQIFLKSDIPQVPIRPWQLSGINVIRWIRQTLLQNSKVINGENTEGSCSKIHNIELGQHWHNYSLLSYPMQRPINAIFSDKMWYTELSKHNDLSVEWVAGCAKDVMY